MKKIALASLLVGALLTACNSGKNDLDHPAGSDGQTESAEEMRSSPGDNANEAGEQAAGTQEGQGEVLQDKPNNSADTSKH